MLISDFEIIKYDELDSTQDEIYRLWRQNHKSKIVVLAKHQTAGRGRNKKVWESPEGSLYFSMLLHSHDLDNFFTEQLFLPLVVGLSLLELLKNIRVNCLIKWPNDIIYEDKKLAGVLCEKKDDAYIVGVGINVMTAPIDSAISLSKILKADMPKLDHLLTSFLEVFLRRLNCTNKFEIQKELNSFLYGKNEKAFFGNELVFIQGISDDGGLIILNGEKSVTLYSGEKVTLIRKLL